MLRNKLSLLILIVLIMLGVFITNSMAVSNDSFLMYDQTQLESIKASLNQGNSTSFSYLIYELTLFADNAMKQIPLSVTEKTVPPPSGDLHDYRSLSIYAWPNKNKSHLPYILKDGLVNPEKDDPNCYDASRIANMTSNVRYLSMAYYLTGKEIYAEKAIEFLDTWFIKPETRMNPNLIYAQAVPGKDEGNNFGIIETVDLIKIIDAAKMLESSQAFTADKQKQLQQWFGEYLNWLLQSKSGIMESEAKNNHSVWYDAQVASFAWYIGQNSLAVSVVNQAKTKRIDEQIEPDGNMPQELARTRSLHYVLYNLQAFITLARVGDQVGVNLWDYQSNGRGSLKKAIDLTIPFLTKKKEWKFQTIVFEFYTDFARYLKLAENHYQTNEYSEAIIDLASKGNLSEVFWAKIACGIP
jgi:hypothetical protein